MTPEFPQCPHCQQNALYPPEGKEHLVCAACGYVDYSPRRTVREQAEDAAVLFQGGAGGFARHWEAKLAEERAKVARLAEGRW
ncbi:hypothetical protein [Myxococcus sp. Y35]|uniref:hypothetical protein n=1 Tax=Pseudomyxococcus flavus TaxID=3115648 RepID=UPI003CEE25F3